MKKFKYVFLALSCVFFFYIASYLVLSVYGRFEPEVVGRNYVMRYAWAPKGSVHNYEWSRSFQIAYHSLWIADTQFWHKSDEALSGKYPVHFEVHTNDYIRWKK